MNPQPIRIRLLRAGHCIQSEHLSLSGAPRRKTTFPALCFLLERQGHAPILYDTGYAADIEKPANLALTLYSKLLQPRLPAGELIGTQLSQLGIDPNSEIDLILSHFHPDHIGGLHCLPNARIHCFRESFESASQGPFPALRHGFFPSQLPSNFAHRAQFVEDACPGTNSLVPQFGSAYQMFGDSRLQAVKLHGHARSQLGLLIQGSGKTAFLVADAAWSSQAIRENRPPSQLTRLAQNNWQDLTQTLTELHHLKIQKPDWHLIPSHCPEYEKIPSLDL